MKVLGVFWGIVGPLLFLFCLALKGAGDQEKIQRAFMAQCRLENAAPGQLDHFETAAPISRYCWEQYQIKH